MGRVTVVGSINLDVMTLVERLPGRGETVLGRSGGQGLGGKGANQAVAALRAGAEVRLVGRVGRDAAGDAVLRALADHGVATDAITRGGAATGYAQILIGDGDNQIVVAPGANQDLSAELAAALTFSSGEVCMAQLEVSPSAIAAAFQTARAASAITLLNVAPADLAAATFLLPLTDVVVANETEWSLMLGQPFDINDGEAALRAAAARPAFHGKRLLVATLGAAGLCALAGSQTFRIAGQAVEVIDTTGAGDCFCGYLAADLAAGETTNDALRIANAAAALAITRLGATAGVPHRPAVLARLAGRVA